MDRKKMPTRGRSYTRPVTARLFPRLAQALEARSWSLADLARAAGIPYSRLTVATWGYRPPSIDTQDRTAAALGVRAHELWQNEPSASGGRRA